MWSVSFCMIVFTISCGTSSLGQITTTTSRPHHTHKPRPTVLYPDLLSTLTSEGQFNTLIDLLKLTGLDQTLNNAPEITLLAPTDAAFAKLPAGALDSLKNDVNTLTDLLKYHAVGDKVKTHTKQDTVFKSLNNDMPIRINHYGKLHTVAAGGVNITKQDIHTKNGYLNYLDGIMVNPTGNIMDIIASRADLSTLNSLLVSTGLDSVIRADQNITIFAPTNTAFSTLDPKVLNYVQANTAAEKEILLFHVVSRMTLYSIGMKHALTFPSADHHHDRIMTLEDNTGEIFVNHAQVTEKDLSGTNGVLHVIDQVLVPTKVLVALEDQGLTIG